VVPQSVSHFIGGRPVRSSFLKTFPVADPATGNEYAQVAVGLAADINQAVLAARAALKTGPWPDMGAAARAQVLNDIADALDSRAGDVAAAEALGTGLPVTQAREQAAHAAELFRRAAGLMPASDSDGASPAPGRGRHMVRRPAGVAGVITPWRTPFLAQVRAVAPALAAGCAVVLKPDEWAPLPASLLAEITAAAGLPDGVLNVVHGSSHPRAPGAEARDAMLEHPDVPVISFAGDPATGQAVMRDAAVHGKDLCAELAGHAPCLIFGDADLDQATDSALFGAFRLNGQRRTASSRILVERSAYSDVVSRLAVQAGRIRVGPPSDPETQIGPLMNADCFERVRSWVRLGMREGARLAAGGRSPADLPEGHYLAATVLADVEPSMQVFGDYVCGPAACVTPFDTEDEAISLAKAMKHALAVYIWTADLQRAHRLASAIESTDAWVNSHNARDLATPSAGAGPAGPSLDFYTRTRAVHIAADETPVTQLGGGALPS
jgi:5-carboxymethyl-2-hydroxymuconic-semialdehyde dehydrogenase